MHQTSSNYKSHNLFTARKNLNLFYVVLFLFVFQFGPVFEKRALADFENNYEEKTRINLEVILDASNSMNELFGNEQKITLAKNALERMLFTLRPRLSRVSLRAFGFSKKYDDKMACSDTSLLVAFSDKADTDLIVSAAKPLQARGKTPIARSLHLAGADLQPYASANPTVLLITDGKETCGEDPVAVVKMLRAQGLQVTVYIVGMGLDQSTKEEFQKIAEVSEGAYYSADNAASLEQSLADISVTISKKMDFEKEKFAESFSATPGGESFQNAVSLKPGKYHLSENLPIGKRAYFFAPGGPAKLIGLFMAPVQSTQDRESSLGQTRCTLTLYGPDKQKLIGYETVFLASTKDKKMARYFDREGKGVYFSIGDDYNSVSKNSWFEITEEAAHDITPGRDASDKPGPDAAAIAWNEEIRASLGLQDTADNFYLQSPKDGARGARFNIIFENPRFQFEVKILDSKTGLPLKTFSVATGQGVFNLTFLGSYEGFRIQILDKNPAGESYSSSYKLTTTLIK